MLSDITTKLITKEDELYLEITRVYQDGRKKTEEKKVIKGFESFTGWYWFATEKEETEEGVIYYGFVQGFEDEWGYFSESELKTLKGKIWEINTIDLPYAGRRERK